MPGYHVVFLHPCVTDADSMAEYMNINNSIKEISDQLVWEPHNPDYVFASELIYRNKKYYKQFRKYYKNRKRIFIFFGGEAVYPDMNLFDYAVCMSGQFRMSDRLSKVPAEYWSFRDEIPESNGLAAADSVIQPALSERKFCNFIYSNPYAHPVRDYFFHELCGYKKVDSLGAWLNNTGTAPGRGETDWLDTSIRLKSRYKFSIAFENSLFEGATTEKLLTSFRAHTVPVYWGNPDVARDYNEKAFINCHAYGSLKDAIRRIKEVDEDDSLWEEMIRQPWQTQAQRADTMHRMQEYRQFISNIFLQDLRKAKRRPEGTFADHYRMWFWEHKNPENPGIRLKRRIIKYKRERQGW